MQRLNLIRSLSPRICSDVTDHLVSMAATLSIFCNNERESHCCTCTSTLRSRETRRNTNTHQIPSPPLQHFTGKHKPVAAPTTIVASTTNLQLAYSTTPSRATSQRQYISECTMVAAVKAHSSPQPKCKTETLILERKGAATC